jgi:hypothetical protein
MIAREEKRREMSWDGTDHDDEGTQGDHSSVLPPHLPSQDLTTLSKGTRLGTQVIGLVEQEFDSLAPVQDFADVLDHDIFDAG